MNLYGYANGDPVNFADPFGLSACPPECLPVFEMLGQLSEPMTNTLTVAATITVLPAVVILGTEAAAATVVGAGVKAAIPHMEHAAVRAGAALGKSQTLGYTVGFAQGFAEGLLLPSGKPQGMAIQPTFGAANATGQATGRVAGKFTKYFVLPFGNGTPMTYRFCSAGPLR